MIFLATQTSLFFQVCYFLSKASIHIHDKHIPPFGPQNPHYICHIMGRSVLQNSCSRAVIQFIPFMDILLKSVHINDLHYAKYAWCLHGYRRMLWCTEQEYHYRRLGMGLVSCYRCTDVSIIALFRLLKLPSQCLHYEM